MRTNQWVAQTQFRRTKDCEGYLRFHPRLDFSSLRMQIMKPAIEAHLRRFHNIKSAEVERVLCAFETDEEFKSYLDKDSVERDVKDNVVVIVRWNCTRDVQTRELICWRRPPMYCQIVLDIRYVDREYRGGYHDFPASGVDWRPAGDNARRVEEPVPLGEIDWEQIAAADEQVNGYTSENSWKQQDDKSDMEMEEC